MYAALGVFAFCVVVVLLLVKQAKSGAKAETHNKYLKAGNELNKDIAKLNNTPAADVDIKRMLRNRRK